MQWDSDDFPPGFFGWNAWELLISSAKLWRMRPAHDSTTLGGTWRYGGTETKLTPAEQQARWYAKLKQDPARIARRNAVKRQNYAARRKRK